MKKYIQKLIEEYKSIYDSEHSVRDCYYRYDNIDRLESDRALFNKAFKRTLATMIKDKVVLTLFKDNRIDTVIDSSFLRLIGYNTHTESIEAFESIAAITAVYYVIQLADESLLDTLYSEESQLLSIEEKASKVAKNLYSDLKDFLYNL